jgi:hypothetical protein
MIVRMKRIAHETKHNADEPNLNAPDDNFFDNKVSSIAVSSGEWTFFRDYYYQNQYPSVVLLKGQYPFVEDVGTTNDDMSSLGQIGLL